MSGIRFIDIEFRENVSDHDALTLLDAILKACNSISFNHSVLTEVGIEVEVVDKDGNIMEGHIT